MFVGGVRGGPLPKLMLPAPIQPILRALVAFLAVIPPGLEVCCAYAVQPTADMCRCVFASCGQLRDQSRIVLT